MLIYPAIDLKEGAVVRLKQGNFNDMTVFEHSPVSLSKDYENKGAEFIHMVDLDGALKGSSFNNHIFKEVLREINIPLQVGGGIRNIRDIEEKLEMGVNRVILGTSAIKNKEMVIEAIENFGEKIVLGVDALNGMVAISGWEEIADVKALDLIIEFEGYGLKTVVYTDISKDGMLQGPNIETTKEIIDRTNLDVIASGGVSCMRDLERLKKISCHGAIVGKAILTGHVDLEYAIKNLRG